MLDWPVRVVERAGLARDPATRRDALRNAYRPFTPGATTRAEHLARELAP